MRNHKLLHFLSFIAYAFSRFRYDKMQPRAASLTFTSLLALVPLLAISFAIFSAFPAFTHLKAEAQSYIFQNFVPGVGNTVQQYLDDFTGKAQGGLSVVGISFLGLTAVTLLLTISKTFNEIWRVTSPVSLGKRLLTYWALLTLGPIFVGINISLSSAFFAFAQTSGFENPAIYFAKTIPFFVVVFGTTFIFMVITNAPVLFKDALRGGLVAGVLLETLKKAFAFYIFSFPTYETIYGALATVPIFLLWMYLSWNVILFSAEFAASFPEWRRGIRQFQPHSTTSPLTQLYQALNILYLLHLASFTGKGCSEADLGHLPQSSALPLTDSLNQLQNVNLIIKDAQGRWYLCQNLTQISLFSLLEKLELTINVNLPVEGFPEGWQKTALQHLQNINKTQEEQLSNSLSDLFHISAATAQEKENIEPNYIALNTASEKPLNTSTSSSATKDPKLIIRLFALLGLGVSQN